MKFMLLSYLRLLTLVSLLASCSKDAVSPAQSEASLLLGRWELIETTGGLAGRTQPADPAKKQEIIFKSPGQAVFLLNGAVTRTDTYTLSQAPAITGHSKTFLNYGISGNAVSTFIDEISASELILSDNYYDGFAYRYARR